MVDALLSAAAESDFPIEDIMHGEEDDDYVAVSAPHHTSSSHHAPTRFCEFCNSSNTPTWRRGPAGKGSLCNACGIKWRLRKRMKKNEKGSSSPSSPPSTPDKKHPSKTSKKRKDMDSGVSTSFRPAKKERDSSSVMLIVHESSHTATSSSTSSLSLKEGLANKRKKYYCKYCDHTFSLSQFRNSQQFGAHCSNCSRRPRFGEDGSTLMYEDSPRDYYGGYSPISSPESPSHSYSSSSNAYGHSRTNAPTTAGASASSNASNRDGLLMRLLYVVEHQLVEVHELAEIKDELCTLKDELISREEARKQELSVMRARVKEDLADIKARFANSVSAHEQFAASRLMEMEQSVKRDTPPAH